MGLENREQAFENKFKHDEELNFKINARRAKLFGQWAASQLNLSDELAEHYVKDVVNACFAKAGEPSVFEKVNSDLSKADIGLSDIAQRQKFDALLDEARQQIISQ
ncbi:MAG: DUF1476 domain-containing protein [Alphaproteobacteria bacterium]